MKMYIYFDRNGTIKEVINDESIRKGSSDYNKIYCYLEGNPDIDDIWYLQKNPDGTLTNEVSFVNNIVKKAIPYDSHRDMKYFQDFEEYQFYVFTLSSSYLLQSGLVVATIRVEENNTMWALGELTFNVQANIVNSDNDITQSQYDYLLITISSYYSKTEIDNKLNLKADKSDTYTKTEVDTINLNLAGQIAGARVELNNRINTTNNILVETNAKVASLETDVDTLQNNTYSKTEVDGKLDLKADKSDTYTKQEINETGARIYTYIDQVDTSLNTRASHLEDRTLDLENDVENLKSVQNVVDVVATKSALNSYDTTKLDANDKVQVIADETHDGASTIYNWSGSAWQYVGAFGGNSYTKQESDNKFAPKTTAVTHTGNQLKDENSNDLYPNIKYFNIAKNNISSNDISGTYKDIFTTEGATTGYYLDNTNTPVSSANYGYTDYIEVNDYDLLDGYFRTDWVVILYMILCYDENQNFISCIMNNNPDIIKHDDWYVTLKLPLGTKYIRMNYDVRRLDNVTLTINIKKTLNWLEIPNKYHNTSVDFVGDSITNGFNTTKTYIDYLDEKIGFSQVNRYGVNGSTIANWENPMYSRVLNIANADTIVVFGGTNDFAIRSRVIGNLYTLDGNGVMIPNLDPQTFYGGVNQMIENLLNTFPNSRIVLCTPIHREHYESQPTDREPSSPNGTYLYQYVEAMKKSCEFYGIKCVDLYNLFGKNPNFSTIKTTYFHSDDGLHPNALGHKIIADIMLEEIFS